jgi:uncharacterized YccA/Bax inhibitor family protein
MQSNNPVFRKSEGFSRQTTAYPDPSSWGVGQGGGVDYTRRPQAPTHRMTIDSVVQKTAMTLAIVFVTAIATWVLTPDITDPTANLAPLFAAATLGSLAAFGLSLVNSFKRVVSPALVMAFAAAEGIALGGLSKLIDAQFGGGIVMQAVIGTFAAFAGTLAAYKFFNIQVSGRMKKFIVGAMFGMIGLSMMELVLGMFGASFGLFGFGALGVLTAVAGLVLGVFMLLMDFDFVEQGVANGIEERESWRAAFAITVSLVWIYTNLLRLLAIFSQE